MKLTKKIKEKIKGFTLIELLITIGILSVLFAIVLIAVNPLEHLNKAQDVSTLAVSEDFASATKYYYTSEKTLPWKKDLACRNEIASGQTITDMPSCVTELTQGGKLQESVINATESKDIYVTECNDGIALCYGPKSSYFGKNSEAKYTKNGVIQPGCPGGANCYSCQFTTNEVQECLQALNPKGSLALVPSPSPTQLLPIPNRNSKQTCSETPPPGAVACMGKVVTDSSGTPLTSLAPPGGFGPDQLHTAYNLPCTPGGPIQAKCTSPSQFGPQTIAIVDAYHAPTLEADLAVYNQTYGLPSCTVANGCLTIVNQNGATSPVPPTDANWALETSLDVQMAHAICQTCKILVVEANSNYFTDLGASVNRAAAMGANAISNSYGARDWPGQTTYDSYYNHPGIFVTASSGDWGYGSYYPSSSTHVIGVGGTTLSLYANNSYASESVWSGTGSGCSLFATAQAFQTGALNWNATHCGTLRGVADVAAVANPSTGVAVYNSTPYAGRSGWWILGGTSVSSPIISAILAMMGNAPQGIDSATYLYQNSSKFRDVTTGSNGSCAGSTACSAGVGYDGPTGLGTPHFLPDPAGTNPTASPIPTSTPVITPTITPTPTSIASSGADLTPPAPVTTLTASVSGTFINLKWNGTTDNKGVFQYRLYKDNALMTTANAKYGVTTDDTQNTYSVGTGYQPSTTYIFYVQAIDASGNISSITQRVSITTPSTDLCTASQTVTIGNPNSVPALPGDTVNNSITVKNNDINGCSSIFNVSKSFPSGWSINGLPTSFAISGGVTQTFYFTVSVPSGAISGNYVYQIWVAKQGQSSVNPVNGSIQVTQLGPTNTPTPTPVTCTHGWSNSLGSTSLSGNPGDTLNQTISITNNNPSSCGSVLFTISHSYPSGWTIANLPPSVSIVGGETKTIPFTITINPQAQQNDYILQYWILSGSLPMNATVHVLSSGPTLTPTPTTVGITCGNLSSDLPSLPGQVKAYLYKDDASFNVCQAPTSGYFQIDVSYDPSFPQPAFNNFSTPDWTRWDRGSCCQTVTGIAFAQNNSWGIPFQRYGPLATGLIIRPNNGGYGFIPAYQVWANWQCGKTLYWRLSKMYDPTTILSPTYSAVISCDTPQRLYYGDWGNYYDGTKQIKYDSRWDANGNGVMDYDDYYILVDKDLVTTYR